MKLILDTQCEVYDLLKPWAYDEFWDYSQHQPVAGAVYLIGRQQCIEHNQRIIEHIQQGHSRFVFSNPHEGSDTLRWHMHRYGLAELAQQQQLLIIGGGDMDPAWPCLQYDSFLPKLLDYEENTQAQTHTDQIYRQTDKPYQFLFLNGRYRPHRKWLIDHFTQQGLLQHSLWTNLDSKTGPVQLLPPDYEVDRYTPAVSGTGFVKDELFNNEWGEIYLAPKPYVDTYFSLVTETVFDYPYSFRTEKIWKPIVMGHPWIAVANQGYYKSMKNLGFQTFSSIIDESFDTIENNDDRLHRIACVVQDLCSGNLVEFLESARSICKYNQQHYAEMRKRVRKEFPDRFFDFLHQYNYE